jgi:Mn-dependent DtxR family transcriptional regulator
MKRTISDRVVHTLRGLNHDPDAAELSARLGVKPGTLKDCLARLEDRKVLVKVPATETHGVLWRLAEREAWRQAMWRRLLTARWGAGSLPVTT